MSLFARLQSLFRGKKSKPSRRKAGLQQRRTFLESLEDRHLMAGFTMDPEFGVNGLVTTDLFGGTDSKPQAVAVQADGKLLIAGGGFFTGEIQRANSDGSPDLTFGDHGAVSFQGIPYGVVQQDDGRIVAAGTSAFGHVALTRYLPDGSLDATFDGDGNVTLSFASFPYEVRALVLTEDGKIVVAGRANTTNELFVARFESDGSLDESFGESGFATTHVVVDAYLQFSIAHQPDGKIVVGTTIGPQDATDLCLARFTQEGSLDQTFGSGGVVTTDIDGRGDGLGGISIQNDDQIIAAAWTGGKVVDGVWSEGSTAFLRYDENGSLDASFDGDGMLLLPRRDAPYFSNIVIQSDGKFAVAGHTTRSDLASPSYYISTYVVAQYNSDGTPDTTFNGVGSMKVDLSSQLQYGNPAGAGKVQVAEVC